MCLLWTFYLKSDPCCWRLCKCSVGPGHCVSVTTLYIFVCKYSVYKYYINNESVLGPVWFFFSVFIVFHGALQQKNTPIHACDPALQWLHTALCWALAPGERCSQRGAQPWMRGRLFSRRASCPVARSPLCAKTTRLTAKDRHVLQTTR